jgi:hypothetical protein
MHRRDRNHPARRALAALALGALAACGGSDPNVVIVEPDAAVAPADVAGDGPAAPADAAAASDRPTPPGSARMIDWGTNLSDLGGAVGTIHSLRCGPGEARLVFGTTLYAGISSICTAAFHSELITLKAGGSFRLRVEPVQPMFTGSLRNGVMSGRWLDPEPSFSFPDARPPSSE